MKAVAILAILALVGTGCATFEDPTIVLDLRMIGMIAHPQRADFAEHVLDVDLERQPTLDEMLEQLNQFGDQVVDALVADPGQARAIRWTMTACALDENSRCDPARPQVPLGGDRIEDPEAPKQDIPGFTGGVAHIEYAYDQKLVALLLDILERDPTRGLGGLDYAVEFRAGAEGAPEEDDIFAFKQIRISPRIPDTRTPNRNPVINELQVALNGGSGFPALPKHCADPPTMGNFNIEADARDVITLYPVEQDGTREEFVVPTIDGQFQKLTEIMSYQWLSTGGGFSDDITGGPPDIFGNETLLGTDWTAPEVSRPTEFPIWLIQRDERYGVSMRELCIRVSP